MSFVFLPKNDRGAIIVCIIYTTGYKTPLCHSPESTRRCGCTVYQHMYHSKISFACTAPGGSLETVGKSLLFGLTGKPPGCRRLWWTSSPFRVAVPKRFAVKSLPPLTCPVWTLAHASPLVRFTGFFFFCNIFDLAQIIDTRPLREPVLM